MVSGKWLVVVISGKLKGVSDKWYFCWVFSLFVCLFRFFNVFLVCPSLFVFLPIFYLLFFVYFFLVFEPLLEYFERFIVYFMLNCFVLLCWFVLKPVIYWPLTICFEPYSRQKNIFSSTKINHLVVFNCFVFTEYLPIEEKKLFWSIKSVRVLEWASLRTRKCEGLKVSIVV